VVRDTLREHLGALYSGNGYDAVALMAHAQQHNLFRLPSTPAAWAELGSAKNVALLDQLGVLKPHEVRARQQIAYERFVQDIEIEARVALSMLRTGIVPAVRADAAADAAAAFSARGIDAKRQLTHSLLEATDALEAALTAMPHASRTRRHSTPEQRCAQRCRQQELSPISSRRAFRTGPIRRWRSWWRRITDDDDDDDDDILFSRSEANETLRWRDNQGLCDCVD
jgi:glutamine synthetase type III